jgi:hypothetical protein
VVGLKILAELLLLIFHNSIFLILVEEGFVEVDIRAINQLGLLKIVDVVPSSEMGRVVVNVIVDSG